MGSAMALPWECVTGMFIWPTTSTFAGCQRVGAVSNLATSALALRLAQQLAKRIFEPFGVGSILDPRL